jgi:hypothetical protein
LILSHCCEVYECSVAALTEQNTLSRPLCQKPPEGNLCPGSLPDDDGAKAKLRVPIARAAIARTALARALHGISSNEWTLASATEG